MENNKTKKGRFCLSARTIIIAVAALNAELSAEEAAAKEEQAKEAARIAEEKRSGKKA